MNKITLSASGEDLELTIDIDGPVNVSCETQEGVDRSILVGSDDGRPRMCAVMHIYEDLYIDGVLHDIERLDFADEEIGLCPVYVYENEISGTIVGAKVDLTPDPFLHVQS